MKNTKAKSDNKIRLKVDRNSSHKKSPCIKKGTFLKEYSNDQAFTFKNFEFLKLGDNYHIIGGGSFGDVFLTRHKTLGKFYAIKQVRTSKRRLIKR